MVVAMVGDASFSGSGESFLSGGADGGSFAAVFLIRGDVADAGVESHSVVLGPSDLELGSEHGDVTDQVEVGEFSLEVPEERFDPGLVGGGAGSAVVGGEPAQGHELSGGARRHLGSIEFSTVVKCCVPASRGSCWLGNGRCLGALADSFLGPLVPSWLAGGGGYLPAGSSGLGRDGVALGHDGPALGFGDGPAFGVA